MATETVTLIVGIAGAVATLTVGVFAYFKDRRDSRTQLLRDADLVERLASNSAWHDSLGVHAQVTLKIYVYERIQRLAEREEYSRRAARSLFVAGASIVGLMALANGVNLRWVGTWVSWALWALLVLGFLRAVRYSAVLGRRRDELAVPNPPGTPPRQPSRAQRLRERSEASRAAVREIWAARKAAKQAARDNKTPASVRPSTVQPAAENEESTGAVTGDHQAI